MEMIVSILSNESVNVTAAASLAEICTIGARGSAVEGDRNAKVDGMIRKRGDGHSGKDIGLGGMEDSPCPRADYIEDGGGNGTMVGRWQTIISPPAEPHDPAGLRLEIDNRLPAIG